MSEFTLIKKSKFYLPITADLLISHYKANNYPCYELQLEAIPPTSNHIWKTDYRRGVTYLTQEAKRFRELVRATMSTKKCPQWITHPSGSVSIVAIFESPIWLPKNPKKAKDIAKKIDVDNRIKSISDAIGTAVGYPDHRAWEVHAYKMCSKRERTHVFIFDLGQNIHYNEEI